MVFNRSLLFYGGDAAISVIGLIFSISSLFFMPIMGINHGLQPIVGFNYGAGQYKRVKEAIKVSLLFSTVIATFCYLLIMIFPTQITMLFGGDNVNIIAMAPRAFRMFLFFTPIVGITFISVTAFISMGRPKASLLMSLVRQVLVLIPAILILPLFFGLDGIFLSGAVADLIASAIAAFLIAREMRRLSRLIEGQPGKADGKADSNADAVEG